MDVIFLKNKSFFPVSHLQGGNVSGENNSFSFIPLDPSMPSKPIPHNTVLPTNQVPKITYYRKNLRKEVVSPTAPSPSVRDSKLTYAQGTTNSNNYNLCAEDNIVDAVDDVVEEDRDNVTVPEEGKAAKCNENRVETH
uniref:Uncharacterized protein n=1 Tax=Cucumis melo subsp. melo TaxID=412675 RepID=E5GCI1_CUCME|nr:hypothetical protein [Cucumis melo subsp. melo]